MSGSRMGAASSLRVESSSNMNFGDGSNRAFFLLAFFIIVALIFFLRLVYLQVIMADEYSAHARDARTANIKAPARRGTIYDRNGVVLATSVDSTSIYVNPYEVKDAKREAAQLAGVLGGEIADYEGLLTEKDISFVYIKRKADVELAEKVKELKLDGIYFITEPKRIYPNGQSAGQIIGFVDPDENGVTGLELYYDDILKGSDGVLVVERGAHGIPIPGGVHGETKAVDGQDIMVSIDIVMQEQLEESLLNGVTDIGGAGGNSVLMDAGTGEIYATASLPFFNPSDLSVVEDGATQLRGITDSFEPGSIFKTVSANAILEDNVLTPESEIFCPSVLYVDGYPVSDSHDRGDQTMNFTQILSHSSNVGISLATEMLGFDRFYQKILNYNLNKLTGVDYPGEVSGYLLEQDQWSTVQSYNVSFGQGISNTPLQIARYYGAIVNEGIECVPHFLVKKINSEDQVQWPSEQVIENKESIPTLTAMLNKVTEEGTAPEAAIEGFTVAGKTGTAEVYDPVNGGYQEGVYNISFVGFLSNSSSQLVCFVGATEVPGERKMTSVFKDIMSYAIERYKITPNEG